MATTPPVFELVRAGEITLDNIATAVDAVIADLALHDHILAARWRFNLREAVLADERAVEALRTDKLAWKCNMVRIAILLARPVEV